MSSRTTKALKGTIASFLQYGLQIVLQGVLAPLILKKAGQEVLGSYSILMQIIGYGILLDFGFSVALSRFLAQTAGFSDHGKKFTEIFTIGRVFLLVTNTVFALFIFGVALHIGSFVVASDAIISQAKIALCFLAVWTIARTPLALYNHGLVATQNMAAANIIAIVGNISRLLLSLALVYFGLGLVGLIVANIVSEGLTFSMQFKHFMAKFSGYSFGWKITDTRLFREILTFGTKYWGVNLAVVLFLGSDSLVVGNLHGASAASVFYTTKIPAFLAIQFIYKLSDNAGPAANELCAQGSFEALRAAYLKLLRYSLLLVFPLSIGIIGFNKEAITAWVGASQYAGSIMSLALAVFAITQVVNHINAMITLAVGNMKRWSTVSIATSLTSLVLSYLLGKLYGLQWVMVGIALMDFPNTVFLFRRSLMGLQLQVVRLLNEAVIPPLMVCLPLCLLVFYLKAYSQMASLGSVIFFVVTFIILWAGSVLAFGLSSAERCSLKCTLKARFLKFGVYKA